MRDTITESTRITSLPNRSDFLSNTEFITRCISILDQDRLYCDPRSAEEMASLQFRLFCAGRHDLALGRVFEGHVDALQILHRYANSAELEHVDTAGEEHAILGVWNAEGPGHHLNFDGAVLSGGKSYASGAGILTHALVTSNAGTPSVQLHLIDLESNPPQTDTIWWQVAGMENSQTHRVGWLDAHAVQIGGPGDYEREPWFSCGALRFATVQVGGLAGLLDAVSGHLNKLGRASDPVQQRRLAELYGLARSASCVVQFAGQQVFAGGELADSAVVANARNVVYDCCARGIAVAQNACGTASYFKANPVCTFAQDLGMYIRQPGPDAQLAKVGEAVANGRLDVWPCTF